jgi:hypothetical protein
MGMKRFGKERFPEQYPATVDEFADPVEGDSPDVAALRPLLKSTNLEFRGLKVRILIFPSIQNFAQVQNSLHSIKP